jgi:hypothetical protein
MGRCLRKATNRTLLLATARSFVDLFRDRPPKDFCSEGSGSCLLKNELDGNGVGKWQGRILSLFSGSAPWLGIKKIFGETPVKE